MENSKDISKCPFHQNLASKGTSNQDWWPKSLNLDILHQHDIKPHAPPLVRAPVNSFEF